MPAWYLAAVAAMLIMVAFSVACFRMSKRHGNEASFWHHVHVLSLAQLDFDETHHHELLAWAKEHRPSKWERIKGWNPPHVRRARCQA